MDSQNLSINDPNKLNIIKDVFTSYFHSSIGSFDQSRLIIHYQPVVCYDSGKVSSLEALLRYNDPKLGLIYPDAFINKLHGEISSIALFKWLLKTTKEHSDFFYKCNINLPISINISSDVFLEKDFIHIIKSHIENIHYNYLILELTECTKIESIDNLNNTIKYLDDLDIKVYLDDFGSGFSNHNLIEILPVNTVKIDKSLIFKMFQSKEDANLIKSIIAVLTIRNIKVIAEGVNSICEAEFLHSCGCQLIQGFGIKKGIKHLDIPLWIKKSTLERDWWTRKYNHEIKII